MTDEPSTTEDEVLDDTEDSTTTPENSETVPVSEIDKLNVGQNEPGDGRASNGGARPGAGRPKGTLNPDVQERRIAEQEFRNRVICSKDALMNAQMTLAQGVQMLYCITTDKKGNRSKPELVTDQFTIEAYLAGELNDDQGNNGDDAGSEKEYYFITTERPDNRALDSLFDRSFGKAKQPIELDADIRSRTLNADVPATPAELAAVQSAILAAVPETEGEA